MLMPIVAFAGLKRSGKDTAGAVFERHGWKKVSFAQPLKDMLAKLMIYRGCDPKEVPAYLEGDKKAMATPFLGGRTARHAMQTLGTEWGRDLMADNLWIDTWERRAFAIRQHYGVVVTDMRFPNEVDTVRRVGGRCFRIDKPDVTAAFLANPDKHPSEAQVLQLQVDAEIKNDFGRAIDFQIDIEKRFF